MAPKTAKDVLDALNEEASSTASQLDERVRARTAQFIINASLQILPLGKRLTVNIEEAYDFRVRESRFMILVKFLARAFTSDKQRDIDWACRHIETELKEHPVVAADFADILNLWKRVKDGREVERKKKESRDNKATKRQADQLAISRFVMSKERDEEYYATRNAARMDMYGDGPRSQANHSRGPKSIGCVTNWHITSEPMEPGVATKQLAKMVDETPEHGDAPVTTSSMNKKGKNKEKKKDNEAEKATESNGWGVSSGDGVLVGHPPEFPAGLLDWEDHPKDEKTVGKDSSSTRRPSIVKAVVSVPIAAAKGALNVANKKDKNQKQQEEVYDASDFEDSEEGSDWIVL